MNPNRYPDGNPWDGEPALPPASPEVRRAQALDKLQEAARHLYGFLLWGPPQLRDELQCYLWENQTNQTADVLLEDIEEALQVLPPYPEGGVV